MAKRTYNATVQAEVAALTRQRIMEATLHLYDSSWMDQITLQQIAERAGVTVQTILRHFTSKEGLELAISVAMGKEVVREREKVIAGDLEGIITYLVQHYESVGDRMIRLLAQESRYRPLQKFMEEGRVIHRDWIGRVFAPYLSNKKQREQLVPQLVAVCDVYLWKLFRRDMGMNVNQYRDAVRDMISVLLSHKGGSK
jgi:AcrR family transcriptional regulator